MEEATATTEMQTPSHVPRMMLSSSPFQTSSLTSLPLVTPPSSPLLLQHIIITSYVCQSSSDALDKTLVVPTSSLLPESVLVLPVSVLPESVSPVVLMLLAVLPVPMVENDIRASFALPPLTARVQPVKVKLSMMDETTEPSDRTKSDGSTTFLSSPSGPTACPIRDQLSFYKRTYFCGRKTICGSLHLP